MEMEKTLYLCAPKEHMEFLETLHQWDHGIVVKDLNPYLTEQALKSYFCQWGSITECKIKHVSSDWPGCIKGLGYVGYSSLMEAEAAEHAGPHYVGGFENEVRRVITPKKEEPENSPIPTLTYKPNTEVGMAYRLANSRWLAKT